MPQSPWPAVACQGLYTKAPLPPPLAGGGLKEIPHADAPPPQGMAQPPPEQAPHTPFTHPETARIKGYPEQHFQHTQMDAERLNQLEARLENLGQRLEDLRGYL